MQYSTHLLRHKRLIIRRNIHHHRSKQKIPLRRLAKLTSLPEILIDYYELGKNEILLDHLLRIACALNVRLEALVRDAGQLEQSCVIAFLKLTIWHARSVRDRVKQKIAKMKKFEYFTLHDAAHQNVPARDLDR